eukprot:TRINITY_DN1188_c0_g1_i2.p1 TRINITY_DN1188_c0_g1~~TRINITY_DN1188_c0_g1_i2.p1  ORF type:complete len:213 (-),score=34.88 TRINITY_DN1188_c0_g1_i2:56-694(-)
MALTDLQVSLKDLLSYHSRTEEAPFARAIPRFPLSQRSKRRRVIAESERVPNFIPPHFPPLPEGYDFPSEIYAPIDPNSEKRQPFDLLGGSMDVEDSIDLMSEEEYAKLMTELGIQPAPTTPTTPTTPAQPASVRPGLVFQTTATTTTTPNSGISSTPGIPGISGISGISGIPGIPSIPSISSPLVPSLNTISPIGLNISTTPNNNNGLDKL